MNKSKMGIILAVVGIMVCASIVYVSSEVGKEPFSRRGARIGSISFTADGNHLTIKNSRSGSLVYRPVVWVDNGRIESDMSFTKEKGENRIKFEGSLIGRGLNPDDYPFCENGSYSKITVRVYGTDEVIVDDLWGKAPVEGDDMDVTVLNISQVGGEKGHG